MPFFILGSGTLLSAIALAFIRTFDVTKLQAFGPTAQVYFLGVQNGLITSTVILSVSFIFYVFFSKYFERIQVYVTNFFTSQSLIKKNLLVLLICFVFSFASHAGNVTHGFFNMDDLVVIGLNNSVSFGESVITPYGNDHLIPLFKTEMKLLGIFFDNNPIPYNLFFFILFALIPFFIYLTFKNLNLNNFWIFLILFTGATSWADMLTGFCIMTIYTQILLFFSISIWAYTEWTISHEKKHLFYLACSLVFALTIDTSGIWVMPAIFLFIATIHLLKTDEVKINKKYLLNFFKENNHPLIVVTIVGLLFLIFMIISFTLIQPNTFLSALNGDAIQTANDKAENWKLIPLTTNFFSFFSNGVSLSLIAPNLVKLLVHPVFKNVALPFWPFIEIFILLLNAGFFWIVFKKAINNERKLIVFLMLNMFITISMVILARPNHEIIPDFDYRYAGAPFFFYILFLSISAGIFVKIKSNYLVKVIIPIVIVIFSAQQAFSFYAVRLKEEARLRKNAFVHLESTLLKEFDDLDKKNISLTVPDLSGSSILQSMPGFTLSNYLLFFNKKTQMKLVRNDAMQPESGSNIVDNVSSLRTSTSEEFKNMLKKSGTIREYYTLPSLMIYTASTSTNKLPKLSTQKVNSKIIMKRETFDPEKTHIVGFSLYTDNTSGNLEISFSFNNDFDSEGKMGKIRIDDYTSNTIENGRRVYHIETDLLQLYTFSLSQKISNLILNIPETKNTVVKEMYLR